MAGTFSLWRDDRFVCFGCFFDCLFQTCFDLSGAGLLDELLAAADDEGGFCGQGPGIFHENTVCGVDVLGTAVKLQHCGGVGEKFFHRSGVAVARGITVLAHLSILDEEEELPRLELLLD